MYNSQEVVTEEEGGGLFEFVIDQHAICKQSKPFGKKNGSGKWPQCFSQGDMDFCFVKKMRTDMYIGEKLDTCLYKVLFYVYLIPQDLE